MFSVDPSKPDEESSNWLYSSMAKYFSHWLPEEQRHTMARAGYFSYKVTLATTTFRKIGVKLYNLVPS